MRSRTALDQAHAGRSRDDALSDLQKRFDTLSDREREIMDYVVEGLMNKQTAATIGLI